MNNYLKSETNTSWRITGNRDEQRIGDYVLPNFSFEKYMECEQDYARLVSGVNWNQHTIENSVKRIGSCLDAILL